MAYARIKVCEDAHDEYRKLYWEANELRIIGTPAAIEEATKIEARMDDLVKFLGYMPAA